MAFLIVDVDLTVDPARRGRRRRTMVSPPSTLDVDRSCAASLDGARQRGRGRGQRWGRTSTYRFAAVNLNARVKVDVIVDVDIERHGNSHDCATCDES